MVSKTQSDSAVEPAGILFNNQKFKILSSKDPDVLTSEVSFYLNSENSWRLNGETFYVKEHGLICQALVRET